jgi:hypothetical protein
MVALEQFGFDACADVIHPCNYQLGTVAAFTVPVAGLLATALTGVLCVLWSRRGRSVALAPLPGIGLTGVAFVVASILNHVAGA